MLAIIKLVWSLNLFFVVVAVNRDQQDEQTRDSFVKVMGVSAMYRGANYEGKVSLQHKTESR